MKHSLSAFAVLAGALLCILGFARFCPAPDPEKGLRRVDLGGWKAPWADTISIAPIPPPAPIPREVHSRIYINAGMAPAADRVA